MQFIFLKTLDSTSTSRKLGKWIKIHPYNAVIGSHIKIFEEWKWQETMLMKLYVKYLPNWLMKCVCMCIYIYIKTWIKYTKMLRHSFCMVRLWMIFVFLLMFFSYSFQMSYSEPLLIFIIEIIKVTVRTQAPVTWGDQVLALIQKYFLVAQIWCGFPGSL